MQFSKYISDRQMNLGHNGKWSLEVKYLLIFTETMFSGGLMGRFCGTDSPPDVTSTDNMVSVIFSSDHR